MNVVLEGDLVLTTLGSVEAEEISYLSSVSRVLVNTKLEVFRELLVELLVVLLVLLDLSKHLKALLDDVLLYDLEDLILLEGLSGDVQREIFRVNNTLNEAEPLRDEFLAIVHDEDTTYLELDVVLLLLGLEEIERSTLRDEEECLELELTFN